MSKTSPAANGSGRTRVTTEVERKFDVDEGFQLPDLAGLPGVESVSDVEEHTLDATYFDTTDLRLLANKHTLRRRTGGTDAGWHLKRPRSGDARDEIRHPLGRAVKVVPQPLQDLVAVHVRGSALAPVVRLTTVRRVRELRGADGSVLAEVALDEVSAARPTQNGRATTTTAWHELEVELVDGSTKLLKAVTKQLVGAGATVSASRSKVGRALAETGALESAAPENGDAGAEEGGAPAVPAEGSAGAVVLAYLAGQVAHLKAQDPRVRADEDDAVHQMRVASRRLRSALATYRPLLDRTVTDPLRDELAWLGGELGAARDAEVVRDHLRAAAEAEPAELLMGPVVARIVTTMNGRYRAAHDEALVELSGPRYFALLDALDALVTRTPWQEKAFGPAPDVLLPLAHKAWKRVRTLVEAADEAPDAHERDLLLHDVRKAAKRARYTGESLSAAFGKPASVFASRMATIQEVLGDHQDSVVVRDVLRQFAVEAYGDGENAFSYGRLHALEQARADRTDHAFMLAWAEASAPEYRTWMKP